MKYASIASVNSKIKLLGKVATFLPVKTLNLIKVNLPGGGGGGGIPAAIVGTAPHGAPQGGGAIAGAAIKGRGAACGAKMLKEL